MYYAIRVYGYISNIRVAFPPSCKNATKIRVQSIKKEKQLECREFFSFSVGV